MILQRYEIILNHATFYGNFVYLCTKRHIMKIVILDGYTANPGDLSWEGLKELGEVTVFERTQPSETVARTAEAEIVLTN